MDRAASADARDPLPAPCDVLYILHTTPVAGCRDRESASTRRRTPRSCSDIKKPGDRPEIWHAHSANYGVHTHTRSSEMAGILIPRSLAFAAPSHL